ncbi:unnamed protein product [Ambrosiozyma monospora]|uniref:Unnamed protein product n=1 Tax=Ambrosiozyma monospora TaxID=43982 RepID=A0ACB5SWM0_AMBMO|nr:unnamed protein product [Ambrosiozyma monospora]
MPASRPQGPRTDHRPLQTIMLAQKTDVPMLAQDSLGDFKRRLIKKLNTARYEKFYEFLDKLGYIRFEKLQVTWMRVTYVLR